MMIAIIIIIIIIVVYLFLFFFLSVPLAHASYAPLSSFSSSLRGLSPTGSLFPYSRPFIKSCLAALAEQNAQMRTEAICHQSGALHSLLCRTTKLFSPFFLLFSLSLRIITGA
eukprot:gene12587-8626_t